MTARNVAITTFIAAIAALIGWTALSGPSEPSRDESMQQKAAAPDPAAGEPFCSGTKYGLDRARREMPYHVALPDRPAASRSNLKAVLLCGNAEKMVAFEFTSGVRITQGPTTLTDPAAAWKELAEQSPGIVTVGEIGGNPAMFTDPAKDPSGTAPGGVEFVTNGVQVAVIGDGRIPLGQLVDVARSLE